MERTDRPAKEAFRVENISRCPVSLMDGSAEKHCRMNPATRHDRSHGKPWHRHERSPDAQIKSVKETFPWPCLTPPPSVAHISRLYGYPFLRASRTEDGRLVTAGLLAHGSDVTLQPSQRSEADRQWLCGKNLPLTVAGAATGSTTRSSHRVPSSSPRALARLDTVTPVKRRKTDTLSMPLIQLRSAPP